MRAVANALIRNGAQAIVAGCTEVPLVLSDGDVAVPLISSTDCLALATIAAAL
jgi:aspartate racemase